MRNFNIDNEPKITTGFTIPDNYFEDFSAKIQSRITNEKPVIKLQKRHKKKWIFAIAATFLLSITATRIFNDSNTEPQVATAALENYISNQSTISQDDLINYLEQEDLESLKNDLQLQDF